jgi:LacI family transcriptional regulator
MVDMGPAQPTTTRPRRETTIHDVARAANVSKTTASRVLNGAPNVAPETRARVLDAVRKIDYRVNVTARSLRTTRTSLVGLLVPAIVDDVFGRIAEGIEEELRRDDVGLVIASSGWNSEGERVGLESLRQRRVDALVLSLVNDCDPQISSVLASITCPIVLLDREVNGFEADAVLTDQRSGVAQAVSHLHALGHRTIGIARHTDLVRPGRECGEAFRQAIAANGMTSAGEIVIEYDHVSRNAGREITDRLTQNGATAILAAVPLPVTAGIFERLDELGLTVPGDISLIPFNDSVFASVMRPPLTVIGRPLDEISRLVCRLVTSRLLDPQRPARIEVVNMQLMIRGSTAAPAVGAVR